MLADYFFVPKEFCKLSYTQRRMSSFCFDLFHLYTKYRFVFSLGYIAFIIYSGKGNIQIWNYYCLRLCYWYCRFSI